LAERAQRAACDDVQAASFVSGDEENFVARQAAFDRALGKRAKLMLLEFAAESPPRAGLKPAQDRSPLRSASLI